MKELIWRTVRAFCIVLAIMMVFTVVVEHRWGARTPHGAAQVLADYYATRELDSHWEVLEVEAEPGRVIVYLTIPSGAAASFQRIPAGAQFQVFGRVCPEPGHSVWARMGDGEDIFIHSASRSGEGIMRRLSCRHWNGV